MHYVKTTLTGRREQLLLLLFSFIYSCCLFSFLHFAPVDTNNNIDGSWPYSLSGLRHSEQDLGTDIFYSYGPLYERVINVVHADDDFGDFLISNLFFWPIILCGTLVVAKLCTLVLRKGYGAASLLVVLLTLLLTVTDIDTVFYLFMLGAFFVIREEKTFAAKLGLLAGVYLFSMYKISFVLPALILTPLLFTDRLSWNRLLQGMKLSLIPFAMYVLLFWLVSGSLLGFGRFIYYGTVNALSYNEFMSLPYRISKYVWISYAAISALTALVFVVRGAMNIRKRGWLQTSEFLISGLAFLMIVFFAFKHDVIRSDGLHLLSFTPIIFLCLLFMLHCAGLVKPGAKHKQKNVNLAAVCVLLIAAVPVHYGLFHHFTARNFKGELTHHNDVAGYIETRIDLLKFASIKGNLNYDYFFDTKKIAIAGEQRRSVDIQKMQSVLKNEYPNKTVLFYGNTTTYAEILREHSHVLYMPYLQNFAAFPPQLTDAMYIRYLDEHPDALIFAEETEPSIDQRIPAHELNNFFKYLTRNYQIVAQDAVNRQFIFKRVSGQKETCSDTGRKLKFASRQTVALPSLPQTKSKEYYKLKLLPNSYPIEDTVSFLVKNPSYGLTLINPGGGTMQVRTTRTTLEHGIAIKPLNMSIVDYTKGQPFELSSFVLNNGLPLSANYSARIELCKY